MIEINQILIIVIPPIFATIGYSLKYVLDIRSKHFKNQKIEKLKIIETKLKTFYYPIHFNLLKENIIWQKILNFYKQNADIPNNQVNMFWELDKELLDIHVQNQNIIKDCIVDIKPDDNLKKVLLKYDEHTTIYNIIRKLDKSRPSNMHDVAWPTNFGSKYPYELNGLIETKLQKYRNRQEELRSTIV